VLTIPGIIVSPFHQLALKTVLRAMTNDPAIRDRIFGQILGEVEGMLWTRS
jgi:hypothetical protein